MLRYFAKHVFLLVGQFRVEAVRQDASALIVRAPISARLLAIRRLTYTGNLRRLKNDCASIFAAPPEPMTNLGLHQDEVSSADNSLLPAIIIPALFRPDLYLASQYGIGFKLPIMIMWDFRRGQR